MPLANPMSNKKKKKRARAHLCQPPACERITMKTQCDRCQAKAFFATMAKAMDDNSKRLFEIGQRGAVAEGKCGEAEKPTPTHRHAR
jgi:hypothetical protein